MDDALKTMMKWMLKKEVERDDEMDGYPSNEDDGRWRWRWKVFF